MNLLRTWLALSLCISVAPAGRAWAIWQQNGTAVTNPPGVQNVPDVIPDGAGGVILVWEDRRYFDADIYAQRMNALGVPQWAAGGVIIATAPNDQFAPKICSDMAGGAVVTWVDERSGSFVYAQRVNSAGIAQWTPNGVPVALLNLAFDPRLVPDGNGGAIVAARSLSGQYPRFVQRLNGTGVPQWGSIGVAFSNTTDFAIAADDAGGAVVAWTDPPAHPVVVQRLAANGSQMWNFGAPASGGNLAKACVGVSAADAAAANIRTGTSQSRVRMAS